MSDSETIEQIIRLKRALAGEHEEAVPSSKEYIGDTSTNRGQKLKRGSDLVYEGRLQTPPYDKHGVKLVNFEGRKRAVVYKRQRTSYRNPFRNQEKEYEQEEEDEDNPYEGVNLQDLLAPITNPADLPSHPSMARAFTSRTIRQLARRAMDIVNEEHKHAVQFSRLMSVFLGDDPTFLKVEKLNLPIYDHLNGITSSDDGPENRINGLGATSAAFVAQNAAQKSANGSGPLNVLKNKNAPSVLKSKVGKTVEQLAVDLDPFFGLPQINSDRDYGIKADDAEDARQLTQIAQQRSEEFIRCMNKVREGLLRAERYQTKVYKWCREMAGDEDDSDGMEHIDTKKDDKKDKK